MRFLFSLSNHLLLGFAALSVAVLATAGGPASRAVDWILKGLWLAVSALLAVCLAWSAFRKLRGWSYYFVHAGLILFSLGLILHARDAKSGEIVLTAGGETAFAGRTIALSAFEIPRNADGSPSQFESTVLVDRAEKRISVNHPLFIPGFMLYQKSYRETAEGFSITVRKLGAFLVSKTNVKIGGTVLLGDGAALVIDGFFPDFYLDENDRPGTRSEEFANPVLHYVIERGRTPVENGYGLPGGMSGMHYKDRVYIVSLDGADFSRTSVLGYASTTGVLLLLFASVLFISGLAGRFYVGRRP